MKFLNRFGLVYFILGMSILVTFDIKQQPQPGWLWILIVVATAGGMVLFLLDWDDPKVKK